MRDNFFFLNITLIDLIDAKASYGLLSSVTKFNLWWDLICKKEF